MKRYNLYEMKKGVEHAFEAAGKQPTFSSALESVSRGGRLRVEAGLASLDLGRGGRDLDKDGHFYRLIVLRNKETPIESRIAFVRANLYNLLP